MAPSFGGRTDSVHAWRESKGEILGPEIGHLCPIVIWQQRWGNLIYTTQQKNGDGVALYIMNDASIYHFPHGLVYWQLYVSHI